MRASTSRDLCTLIILSLAVITFSGIAMAGDKSVEVLFKGNVKVPFKRSFLVPIGVKGTIEYGQNATYLSAVSCDKDCTTYEEGSDGESVEVTDKDCENEVEKCKEEEERKEDDCNFYQSYDTYKVSAYTMEELKLKYDEFCREKNTICEPYVDQISEPEGCTISCVCELFDRIKPINGILTITIGSSYFYKGEDIF